MLFLIFVFVIAGFLKLYSLTEPVDINDDEEFLVKIEPGKSGLQIGEELYEKDLIQSRTVFNLLVMIKGFNKNLQAGYYEFSRSEDLNSIIDKLVKGDIATFTVTIPEGFDVKAIAHRLAELTIYEKEQFLAAANNKNLSNDNFINSEENTRYVLEGFLYPSTYNLPQGLSPDRILSIFVRTFENEWGFLVEEKIEGKKYNIYEIITIASMIEREAKLEEEKPLISAVIYNRLNRDMLLQIDATVQYVLEEWKENLLYQDLEIDSAYNTYRYKGLPPGPISNPGDKAIEAALNPDENTDYLFYFALRDGSHVFSKTYQKHLQKQSEMRKKGKIHESEINGPPSPEGSELDE